MTTPPPAAVPDRTPGHRAVTTRAARLAALVFAGVVAFQLAVVLGAPWGAWTQGGATSGTLPPTGRALAAVSALLLGVMALALLARAGEGPLARAPGRLVAVLAWGTVGYLVLGLVANLATPSAQERALWAPVVAVLLLLSLAVVLTSRRSGPDAGGEPARDL